MVIDVNTLIRVNFKRSNKKHLPNCSHEKSWLLLSLLYIYNTF